MSNQIPKLTQKHFVAQRTLKEAIRCVGVGLHSAAKVSMIVRPAPYSRGIYFQRKDVPAGTGLIPARCSNVVETRLSTVLGNEYGVTVSTVEHLLAALSGCGVDNAIIDIDGPEVPIMDGSAGPFVTMIERHGTVEQESSRYAIWVRQPVELHQGDRYAILMPSYSQRITVSIDFPGSIVGPQTLSVELVNEAFVRTVARARTFGFAHEIARLRKMGLALGGSLQNAVLVDGERIVNEEGLRYKDEFVRHKILDCLGDLSLAGVPILGHYYSYKPGHQLNVAFLRHLFDNPGAWSYISFDEYYRLFMGGSYTQTHPTETDGLRQARQG